MQIFPMDLMQADSLLYFVKEFEYGIPVTFTHWDLVFSDKQYVSFKTINTMYVNDIAAVNPIKGINGKMFLDFGQNH